MQPSKSAIIITLVLGTLLLIRVGFIIEKRYGWDNLLPERSVQTVYDDARLLTADKAAFIQKYHQALLKDHGIDYRVVIADGDADNNLRANQEFEKRNVGSLSESGRGLLLLVDPHQNEVRLEVSTSLESVYTDAFVSYLQHRQMIPFFRTERVAEGILATTEMIFTRAQDAHAGHAFSPPMDSASMGGGAINPAQIGAGADNSFRQGPDIRSAPGDPGATLLAYRQAMDARNGNPDLSIYTKDTRSMLNRWTVTPAQMDNESRNLKSCMPGTSSVRGDYAVIRFPVQKRQCPPYFFKSEDGHWKLDLTMMQKAIRFNHRNEWHFDLKYSPFSKPYSFAFTDWRFDKYGFPHAPKP